MFCRLACENERRPKRSPGSRIRPRMIDAMSLPQAYNPAIALRSERRT